MSNRVSLFTSTFMKSTASYRVAGKRSASRTSRDRPRHAQPSNPRFDTTCPDLHRSSIRNGKGNVSLMPHNFRERGYHSGSRNAIDEKPKPCLEKKVQSDVHHSWLNLEAVPGHQSLLLRIEKSSSVHDQWFSRGWIPLG